LVDNLDVAQIVLDGNLNIVYCDGILNMICVCSSYIKGAKRMKFDKTEISGLLVLFIGVGLLAFTFLNAYWLLTADVGLVATQDLVAAFGSVMAPLIATVIRVMYLGIMGWIGSLLTLRGIPLLTHAKPVTAQPTPTPQQPVAPQAAEQEAKPKEPKKEPEKKLETGITVEVRPPQEATQTPQKPSQDQQP
jgi:hypothetical protein